MVKAEYKHLISLTIAYAACFWFSALLTKLASSEFFATVGVFILVATLHLSSMWAALGPGSYLKRAPITLLAVSLVAAGGFSGLFLFDVSLREVITVFAIVPMIWVAAQLPHWILRMTLGWRIVLRNWVEEPVGILDLACITGFSALALALFPTFAQQFGGFNQNSAIPALVSLGVFVGLFWLLIMLPAIWFILYPSRAIRDARQRGTPVNETEQKVNEKVNAVELSLKEDLQDSSTQEAVPTDSQEYHQGCINFALYTLSLGVATPFVLSLFTGQPAHAIGFSFVALGSAIFVCLPIMFSRQAGFYLSVGPVTQSRPNPVADRMWDGPEDV